MRAFNRMLTLLFGVTLMVLGVLALVEIGAFALGLRPVLAPVEDWLGTLRERTFSDRVPLLVFTGLAVLGLALLIAEARPWPKRRAQLATDDMGVWWVLRRSAEGAISRAILQSTPAVAARVKLAPKARRWLLRVQSEAPAGEQEAIERQASSALERLGAPSGSQVKVSVQRLRRTG